jgi:hypothetical protein
MAGDPGDERHEVIAAGVTSLRTALLNNHGCPSTAGSSLQRLNTCTEPIRPWGNTSGRIAGQNPHVCPAVPLENLGRGLACTEQRAFLAQGAKRLSGSDNLVALQDLEPERTTVRSNHRQLLRAGIRNARCHSDSPSSRYNSRGYLYLDQRLYRRRR